MCIMCFFRVVKGVASYSRFCGLCSFVGAAAASIIRGFPLELAVRAGLKAAHTSLLSAAAVSEEINPQGFEQLAVKDWADSLHTRVIT